MSALLKLKGLTKVITNQADEDNRILDGVDFTLNEGEFVTVLGGNGAGKSTLFNSITGSTETTGGTVELKDKNLTKWKEEKRAGLISRVFQDPKMGTAPRMTVAENLLLAKLRGERKTLKSRSLKKNKAAFVEMCASIGNGLEKQIDAPAGNLSGGQRQSLSLLMATMTRPDLLLLDEHTAALDPKTSKKLMELTDQIIKEKQLTCMMITHQMEDALAYGNRLIVMKDGKITLDLDQKAKEQMTMQDLLKLFEEENLTAVL
ncbi:ATP-binding cassette domain-containing protein [Marinilactibacillus sp. XAAS-LB27]|uniref:ABC transporter ATP-binding protein n=1 Tax=Marinilactibacillus sp. XAAS-LB27 TaxID=3114538 RepID=UPI002E186BC8|nr:ATP-binding cassette domain-containing protein [Marinilactibacillus sp. XAAS-LB27]